MANKKAPGRPRGTRRRLVSVAVPLEGVGPEALLRMDSLGPRGFWAREGRWFAHLGAAARVEVGDPSVGSARFQNVWDQGRKLLEGSFSDPDSAAPPPPPRLFGGFAFQDSHTATDAWEGFPTALFVLPEVELMGEGDEAILTCRGFLDSEEDEGEFRGRLKQELESVSRLLTSPDEHIPSGELWIPATRVETDLESWRETVDEALTEMRKGGIDKVVLARVQSVSAEGGLDPVDVVMNLWEENPSSHVFLFQPQAGQVLLGAAPETVATLEGGRFRATAVAGSIPRGVTEAETAALAARLLASKKDRLEHRVCAEDMVARIGPLAKEVRADEKPHVLSLSTIQHLETVIEAELEDDVPVLSALEALHPTPAVCGFPRDLALEFLNREEPFHRGWYSGPVGWFDGTGDGVFVPALRSAAGQGDEWRLFAGAGIVVGSEPQKEWDETRIKFQPVLRALARARAGRTVGASAPGAS